MTIQTIQDYIEVGPTDFLADIEYSYTPGCAGRFYGPPEDWYPPCDAELEITSVIIYINEKKNSKLDISDMLEDQKFYTYIEDTITSEMEKQAESIY